MENNSSDSPCDEKRDETAWVDRVVAGRRQLKYCVLFIWQPLWKTQLYVISEEKKRFSSLTVNKKVWVKTSSLSSSSPVFRPRYELLNQTMWNRVFHSNGLCVMGGLGAFPPKPPSLPLPGFFPAYSGGVKVPGSRAAPRCFSPLAFLSALPDPRTSARCPVPGAAALCCVTPAMAPAGVQAPFQWISRQLLSISLFFLPRLPALRKTAGRCSTREPTTGKRLVLLSGAGPAPMPATVAWRLPSSFPRKRGKTCPPLWHQSPVVSGLPLNDLPGRGVSR